MTNDFLFLICTWLPTLLFVSTIFIGIYYLIRNTNAEKYQISWNLIGITIISVIFIYATWFINRIPIYTAWYSPNLSWLVHWLDKIGDNISVNYNVNINSCNNGYIEIGNDVLIGQNTVLRASDHKISNQSKKINEQSHTGGKIIIGNNVWIGANCVILKNVKIEDNSVIGAGAIISKNVKKNEIIIGNQQRFFKKNI